MKWYLQALKKYAVFEGRARRKEFWYFILFYFIIVIVLGYIDAMIGTVNASLGLGMLSGIFVLAMIIPDIAVTIRRLHDTDRTGWWWLIAFIPVIGVIWLLVLMVLDGTSGKNQYGPDPKEATT